MFNTYLEEVEIIITTTNFYVANPKPFRFLFLNLCMGKSQYLLPLKYSYTFYLTCGVMPDISLYKW